MICISINRMKMKMKMKILYDPIPNYLTAEYLQVL